MTSSFGTLSNRSWLLAAGSICLLSVGCCADSVAPNGTGGESHFDAWATVWSTVIATVIASIVAWQSAERATRAQERSALDDQIVKVIEIGIEYPYVENDDFCAKWPDVDKNSEQGIRYDNYCCLVFNLMERLWRHFEGDREKIENMLYAPEMAHRHRRWWQSDKTNETAYEYGFRQYINTIIREQEKGA